MRPMTDQQDPSEENQIQRAIRLREQIERLKAGRPIKRPDRAKSLREQIDERADQIRRKEAAKRCLVVLSLTASERAPYN